ncbi:MAG: protein-glutamate O-methyltransferase CheR [Proteobacteria bacterium]|nr:protein-glutamate O-methyltransferase CheR [Pseudomonadota bacterium]
MNSSVLKGLPEPVAPSELSAEPAGLDAVLQSLFQENVGDFRNYKRSSLRRRVIQRLRALDISSYADYVGLLKADPDEYAALHAILTIKVSEFFRDPTYFALITRILKEEYSDGGKGLRAWCCGCATGEEAYSLAILLSEHLLPERAAISRVFATDVDAGALDTARRGEYRHEYMENVSEEFKAKYFIDGGVTADKSITVAESLRGLIRFGTLDIVTGHAFSRIDMLFCRNLFIYFNKKLQSDVFAKFHYALAPGGLIVLGKAEVIPAAYADQYQRVEMGLGVYRKRRSGR